MPKAAKEERQDGDRVQISLRVPVELKRQIEDAADHSGRSQAQELELMVQRGFDRRELLPEQLEAVYGGQLAALMLAVGEMARQVGPMAAFVATGVQKGDWLSTPAAYRQVREGVLQILDAVAPDGDATIHASCARLGVGVANALLEEIASGLSRTPTHDAKRAATLHALAGSLAERLAQFDLISGGGNAR